MAFEKLRTIVITAIPKPRSRERFRKIAETTPTPRKRALRKRCLSPQKMRSAEQVRCLQSAARNPSITAHPVPFSRLANDLHAKGPRFWIICGQEFDCAEPVFLILPVRLEIVFARGPQGRRLLVRILVQNSRYTVFRSLRFFQGFGERPGPCKHYVSLYAIFLSRL
jgi:hypothetical protein